MQFLRTEVATQPSEPPNWWENFLEIDTANPNYRGKYHRIHAWLIEFDEDGMPWREIGLDQSDPIVVAGPSETDYGYWLDTNMQYSDFGGEEVAEEYFELIWAKSGVIAP